VSVPGDGRSAAPPRFGTSGWRGILGDEIDDRRTAAVASGVAAWLASSGARGPCLVAHDRRFGGPRLAALASEVLSAHGIASCAARGAVATPVVARALARGDAETALVFTASHNPPSDHGLKLLVRGGASAPPDATRAIERAAAAALAERAVPRSPARGLRLDLTSRYLHDLAGLIDRDALRRAQLRVACDALHGAGAGLLDVFLASAGVRVVTLRGEPDLRFGGAAPDPRPERLASLRRRVAGGGGIALGLATDGDADRYAAIDSGGRLLDDGHVLALLVDHLARTGRIRRGVAISWATSSLVERVARAHGLAVERFPIGFKHLAVALAEGRADAAGEESGGFALAAFHRDKDGVLAGALIAELAAVQGAPLAARARALERVHGPSVCGRIALRADARAREALARLVAAPPERACGARVREVDARDGLRLALDDGFVGMRASGTEGVLRVYAEAPDARALARRLAAGRAWLRVDTPARCR
jgi:phosphomannomutase